jgi:hypothetical protein
VSEEPKNIAEAIALEIHRNRELLEVYRSLPTGAFGATTISIDIKNAVDALASGDVIKILQAYETLKKNE